MAYQRNSRDRRREYTRFPGKRSVVNSDHPCRSRLKGLRDTLNASKVTLATIHDPKRLWGAAGARYRVAASSPSLATRFLSAQEDPAREHIQMGIRSHRCRSIADIGRSRRSRQDRGMRNNFSYGAEIFSRIIPSNVSPIFSPQNADRTPYQFSGDVIGERCAANRNTRCAM